MEDKQRQVKEIEQIIYNDYKVWLDVTGCITKDTVFYKECLGGATDCAEKIYGTGYRDCKDKVVLSREEYTQLLKSNIDEVSEYIADELKQARKETVEKIMLDLKPLLEGFIHKETGENLYVYKCKQFGVEVKE